MKKGPIIFIMLIALVVVGIFLNGPSSFLRFVLQAVLTAIILVGVFWLFFIRRGPSRNYRKAAKQSKHKQKKAATAKKRKSPFKVIEGGKK